MSKGAGRISFLRAADSPEGELCPPTNAEPEVSGSCVRGCCPSPAEHFKSLTFVDHGEGSYHLRDRQLTKDRDAYKRLRMNGTQPKGINGCHRLEQMANTTDQVERGK